MGDRVNAQINIGGKVRNLSDLIACIQSEDLGPDWGESFQNTAEILAYLQAADDGGAFFCRHEVNGGEFSDLTEELEKQGMFYVQEFDGYGGSWGPGRTIFGPAGQETHSLDGDGGTTAITASEIRHHKFADLAALLAYLDAVKDFKPGAVEISPEVLAAYIAEEEG